MYDLVISEIRFSPSSSFDARLPSSGFSKPVAILHISTKESAASSRLQKYSASHAAALYFSNDVAAISSEFTLSFSSAFLKKYL